MAGQPSNYASEIQQAIREAIEQHLSTRGMRYEPPVGPQSDVDFQQKHPDLTVPTDVAHMVYGMQRAREESGR